MGITDSCWALLSRVGHYSLSFGGRVGGILPTRRPNTSGFALQWNISLTDGPGVSTI